MAPHEHIKRNQREHWTHIGISDWNNALTKQMTVRSNAFCWPRYTKLHTPVQKPNKPNWLVRMDISVVSANSTLCLTTCFPYDSISFPSNDSIWISITFNHSGIHWASFLFLIKFTWFPRKLLLSRPCNNPSSVDVSQTSHSSSWLELIITCTRSIQFVIVLLSDCFVSIFPRIPFVLTNYNNHISSRLTFIICLRIIWLRITCFNPRINFKWKFRFLP